jgi:CRISPR-associated endonuclease/helicase Cas3
MKFVDFFERVTGFPPFDWQVQVANHLCENWWHDALSLPPATGKTSIIEIWYYALYYNIQNNPSNRHIPIRLWYIVDRKVIVDGAAESAKNLLDKITSDKELIPIGEVIKNHFKCEHPLFVGKIRGGMERNDKNKWLTYPNQPTIVTSTIDQYGSRLLFRGYGVSPKTRSIHAAMTAIDSLVALDEAHLSQPLKSILNVVKKDFRLEGIPLTQTIELTATGNNQNLFPVDVKNDVKLNQRLNVKRLISLVSTQDTIKSLVSETNDLTKKFNVIATICNTVLNARKVYAELKKSNDNVILLIGRIRSHERDLLYKNHVHQLLSKRDRSQDKPLIVVSTQTIEVGADFDFDAMVSQAAPLDCLIQRFGRLDRLGKFGKSIGSIIFEDKLDPVYGEVTKKTFDWLTANNTSQFDISTIQYDLKYFAKTNHIGLLSKNIVEILAHTYPSQEISLDGLLHGVKLHTDSEFQIIYRNEISEDLLQNDPEMASKWLEMNHQPQNQEILSLPIYCLEQKDAADSSISSSGYNNKNTNNKLCIRYRDGQVIPMKTIVPGDLVIAPTSYGQYDDFGWNPNAKKSVEDVSDYYSKVVRIHPFMFPDFKLDQYMLDEAIDADALVEDIEENLIHIWKESGHEVVALEKHLHLLATSKVKLTPDRKGVYFYTKSQNYGNKEQKFIEHNAKVGENAKLFAETVGLPEKLIRILERSGQCHDLGKADPRFQEGLYFPNKPSDVLLAKSSRNNFGVKKRYPKGWRHELQSLSIALENNLGEDLFDLKLFHHLIASHHGHYRSGIPMIPDDTFTEFQVNGLKSTQPYFDVCSKMSRVNFYELNDGYGFWGLAYLEAIIRLGDWKN